MLELTREQTAALERLHGAGFALVAFPLYASHVGVRKGNCAALLEAVPGGGMRIFGEPSYLVDGNLSVRVRRRDEWWFVWKKQELAATPARLAELEDFRRELDGYLTRKQ